MELEELQDSSPSHLPERLLVDVLLRESRSKSHTDKVELVQRRSHR